MRQSFYNFSLVYMHFACVHYALNMRMSGFVLAITCTFMHRFHKYLAQLFSLMSRSAILNIGCGRLKVKVTHEGKMILSLSGP